MIKTRSNDRQRGWHATTECDHGTAERRCAPRRSSIAVLLLLFTLGCWGGSSATAEERQHTRREQNPNSALRKLDLLQQSVKQKLKNALGVKGQHDANEDAQGNAANETNGADDRYAQTQGRSLGNGVTANGAAQAGNPSQPQYHPKWTPQPTSPAGADRHPRWVPPNGHDDGSRGIAGAAENRWEPERYTQDQYLQDQYFQERDAQQQYAQQPYPHEQYTPAHYTPAQYASPNPMRAAESAEQHAVGPAAYNQIQRPLPPPIADLATGEIPHPDGQPGRGPTRRWDGQGAYGQEQGHADPHYSVPSGMGYRGAPSRLANASVNTNAPLARGSVLGDNQITATQHALRLLEENGDLKAKLAMLDAESKRLKEKLDQTETLLGRSTKAVEGAYEEIEATRQINRELQTKLNDAEQKYNRYLMETDRMLQAIREELDDVLVREISANGT